MTKDLNTTGFKWPPNFKPDEFNHSGGNYQPVPYELWIPLWVVAWQEQRIRDEFGYPFVNISGYRDPLYNRQIGGAKKSQHMYGRAIDFKCKDIAPIELYHCINALMDAGEILQGGIGLYDDFVHLDIRGEKTTWDNRR